MQKPLTKAEKYAAKPLEKQKLQGAYKMNQTAKNLRKKLLSQVKKMGKNPQIYASRPGRDFTRRRALDFEKIILLLLTMGCESVGKNLMKAFHFREKTPSASAFVQQRKKLLPKAFEDLFHSFTDPLSLEKKYRGYRLLAVDGTSLKSPAYPADSLSYLPGTDRQHGWNKHLINALFDLENGIYTDLIAQKEHEKNEGKALCEMADRSQISDPVILLADRNYASLNNLAHLENRGWKYVIRLKERPSVFGVKVPVFSEFDMPISLTLGRLSKRKLTAQKSSIPTDYYPLTNQRVFDFLPTESTDFYRLSFRIVRINFGNGKSETLLTNLSKNEFPPETLKHLYAKRWGIETSFRSLKYSVGLIHLHSKIPDLILQEIFAAFLIFNFAQAAAWNVKLSRHKAKQKHRLNFSDAVFACCAFLRKPFREMEMLLSRKYFPIKRGRTFQRPVSSGNRISWFYLSAR